jgi:hypothetical protein
MMEEGYHVTTQNRFYPDMSDVLVNKKTLLWRLNLSAHLHNIVHTEISSTINCNFIYIKAVCMSDVKGHTSRSLKVARIITELLFHVGDLQLKQSELI